MKAPFEPTVCSCKIDRENCQRQPGHLIPGQLTEILERLGESPADAGKWFWNSPGMVLSKAGRIFRLRTITPRFAHGKCVFYENGLCRIHEIAPFGCRYFDAHMSANEGQRRAAWGAVQIFEQLESYSSERDRLPMATHYKPSGYSE